MAVTHDILQRLPLGGGEIDRSANERRDSGLIPRLLADPATGMLAVRGQNLPVRPDGGLALRSPEAADLERLVMFLGRDRRGKAYVGVVEPESDRDRRVPINDHEGPSWTSLRQAGLALSEDEASLAATALALAHWHRVHTNCSRCGAPTQVSESGWVRRCVDDGTDHFPRTDPAVIMGVTDPDDRLLIARNIGWEPGRFAILAGFVEPGESFEAAVAREVLEEVGLVIDEVTYLGNQPWPFPSGLMIGYAARTLQTHFRLDPTEIAEARWVTREEYVDLIRSGEIRAPFGISIAQRIIENWLGTDIRTALG